MKHLLPHTLIAGGLTLVMSSPQAAYSEAAYERWQQQRLLHPGETQLEQERQGKIFIYDGLSDKEVDRVLDKQFNRMQFMMFIRTIITDDQGEPKHDESGKVLAEDDDC
jgi:hypothetical protein